MCEIAQSFVKKLRENYDTLKKLFRSTLQRVLEIILLWVRENLHARKLKIEKVCENRSVGKFLDISPDRRRRQRSARKFVRTKDSMNIR